MWLPRRLRQEVKGGPSRQLAGIPSLVWDVAGSAETGGTPGSGSTTMGVASPTMGGNIERTFGTMHCLPVGRGASRGGCPSTGESAATPVVVSSTVSSTVVSMGLQAKQGVSLQGSRE